MNKSQSQSISEQFSIQLGNDEIITIMDSVNLKITLINSRLFEIFQITFDNLSLPPDLKNIYGTIQKLFSNMRSIKDSGEKCWEIKQPDLIHFRDQMNRVNQIKLNRAQNIHDITKVILIKTLQNKLELAYHKHDSNEIFNKINQNCTSLDQKMMQNQSDVNQLKNRMQDIENNLVEQKQKLTQLDEDYRKYKKSTIQLIQRKASQQDQKLKNSQASLQKSIKDLQYSIEVTQKQMWRNIQTVREELVLEIQKLKIDIQQIYSLIQRYDFPKIQKDIVTINQTFQYQIRINQHYFSPEVINKEHKKIYFLNNRTIKNLQDVKDYNKIFGKSHFAKGRFNFRVKIKTIKNNGLIIGIGSEKVKDIDRVTFNDINLISLSSCGYVINKGVMIPTHAKLLNGQIIKVMVDTYSGVIKWYSDEIEIATAELGILKELKLYPMVGLGYFGDEIDIVDINEKQQKEEKSNENYFFELQRLNRIYGIGSK